MCETKEIDLRPLGSGPSHKLPLPPELLDDIRTAFDFVGPYVGMTLEQFEESFRQNANPEDEVAIWCTITAAWLAYHDRFLRNELLPEWEERKLLESLATISTGVNDASQLNVTPQIGRRLLLCYEDFCDIPSA